jgi:hypothetical protein
MSTSVPELQAATAVSVNVTKDMLAVDLSDGRTIAAPVAWFPRLRHGTMAERRRWRIIGPGMGIHWPELDEDISVEGLLLGRPSGESQASIRRWLEQRKHSKSGNGSRGRRKK